MSLEDLSTEARDELALLAKQLSENPETRKDFLRQVKKVKPEMPIPELEIEDYTRNAVDKANDRVAQLEAKLRERDAMDELNARRNKLKAKGLIDTDEQIEEVEKVMLEKGITNHEAGAEYWRWMQQSAAPTPTGYNPSAINKFDLSKYWRNPVAGARDEAAKALNELRKNPRPIGL
jgi:chromosome segregation ATPase